MQDRIAFGSFELDLKRRVLLRHGVPVPIGSRAADVLFVLAAAPGELVTKDALLSRVWPDTVVEENNLQVQISALRRVFAADAAGRGWVKTVPGRGYRFTAPLERRARGLDGEPPAIAQEVEFVTAPDSVHLAAAAIGEGPRLLRTGMWMTHLEHEWRTQIWGPLLARLAQHCRLARYDPRGMGLSDREVPPLSFPSTVSDLEAVADHFFPGRFALLGMSQGVPAAIEYAARHPDRVACLVLHGGYVKGWRVRGDPRAIEMGEAFATLTRQGWGQANPVFRQIFTSLAMPDASREEADSFNELQRLSASAEVAAELVQANGRIDVEARCAQLRVPTLVLHSEHDAWVSAALGRAIAQGIAGAKFIPLASSSHVVMPREPAWERFVGSIVEFVHAHSV